MDTATTTLTWANVFTLVAGILIGATPSLINAWTNRKKVVNEVAEIEARTELTRISTRSTELRDDLATGEGVGNMLTVLMKAGETIREQQEELFELKGRTMRAEADAQAAQMFVEQLNAAAKLAICEHHPHGVRLADYSPQQLRRVVGRSDE